MEVRRTKASLSAFSLNELDYGGPEVHCIYFRLVEEARTFGASIGFMLD